MKRLRTRLVLLFLATTLPPLVLTLWLANSLLQQSLDYSSTAELDQLSRTLEETSRILYQRERERLAADAASGRLQPEIFSPAGRMNWPAHVREFDDSRQLERYALTGNEGDTLELLVRKSDQVHRFRRHLGGVRLEAIRKQHMQARRQVAEAGGRDLPRGFSHTLLVVGALPWAAALVGLLYFVHRISRPIHDLTAALEKVAAGDLSATLPEGRAGEIGSAMSAFNRMTSELLRSRERLLYLTRLESWQALARKTAHEIKNSLTPIRLTMEELAARHTDEDSFHKQASQIIVDEVNSLERRVRAFSDFAAEPPVRLHRLDAAAVLRERLLLLRNTHPEVDYQLRLHQETAPVLADEDLLKATVTNLLVNASEAAGRNGKVLVFAQPWGDRMAIEVHDNGPGLSPQAVATLFEPTISFKKGGMGLGLSIARKSALLCGGDIVLVKGELGGAGFRVLLSASCPSPAS